MVIGNVLLIVLIMFSFPVAEKVRDLFESVNLPHHVKMVKGLEKIFRVLLVMSFFTLIIELCITEKSVLWQDLSLNATLLILIACAMFVFVMVFFKFYCLWRFISVELLIRRLAKGNRAAWNSSIHCFSCCWFICYCSAFRCNYIVLVLITIKKSSCPLTGRSSLHYTDEMKI